MLSNYLQVMIIGIVTVFLYGCNSDVDNHATLNLPVETKACIIIPGVGCDGCIAAGLDFIVRNKHIFEKEQNDFLVVFTALLSKKMLYRTLKEYDIENIKMLIDEKNDFLVDGYEQYPILCIIGEDGKQELLVQNPENPRALYRIHEIVNKYYDIR